MVAQPWDRLPPIAGGEEEHEEEEDFELRYRRYGFLIVGPRPFRSSQIQESLATDLTEFGRALKKAGVVNRISPESADRELANTAKLNWPGGLGDRIRETTDPFILILNRDRRGFDPSQHKWAIIWLSDYDPTKLYQVFSKLSRITHDPGEDLFDKLRAEAGKRQAKKFGKKLNAVIKLQPSLFGITLDVNALLSRDE